MYSMDLALHAQVSNAEIGRRTCTCYWSPSFNDGQNAPVAAVIVSRPALGQVVLSPLGSSTAKSKTIDD
jgi:hypothetical protein